MTYELGTVKTILFSQMRKLAILFNSIGMSQSEN
jgi:hypothetical protein